MEPVTPGNVASSRNEIKKGYIAWCATEEPPVVVANTGRADKELKRWLSGTAKVQNVNCYMQVLAVGQVPTPMRLKPDPG